MRDREDPPTQILGGGAGSDLSSPTLQLGAGAKRRAAGACRTFSAGSLVAGRYRVVRFIAAGGMGEVYEAEDQELGGRVALKTLRPEITGDPQSVERFKQEIALARQVTHRNVCRIFDVGWHREGSAPDAPGVAFLTMELLAGETLADLLRREGPLPVARAVPLLRQMADALTAAHAAGVIHRDFKSANVVLEPTEMGVRAVVTDFGLARTGMSTGKTDAGEIVGTPDYMAPEQLEGGAVSPATDVYAFGVVMCEMFTGQRSLAGDRPKDRSGTPDREKVAGEARGAVPGARWASLMGRCLERDLTLRYKDAAVLLAAVDRAAGHRRRLWMGFAVGAAAVVVFALALAVPYLMSRKQQPVGGPRLQAARGRRASVAVLGFRNLTGRPEAGWMSTALSEMLTTELSAGERLRTLPGEAVARMKVDLGVADAESLAPDTLAKIHKALGADYVVMGAYVALGGAGSPVRLDVRLQDAAAGKTVAAMAETGTEDQLFELASSAGAALRSKLGVPSVTASEAAAARASLPSNPEASRLYAQGLENLRRFEFLAARDQLEKAVMLSPSSPSLHAALSEAWSGMGYMDKARAEARQAYGLSARLPRAERLSIEGRYREANAEWDKAAVIYRSLWTFYPDNLDYGLRLALAQRTAGDAKAALLTLGSLRKLPGSVGQDPRIDLEEAKADEALSDYPGSLSASQRAVSKARQAGARLMLAQGLAVEGAAFRNKGELGKASASLSKALSIYGALGDLGGEAQMLKAQLSQRLATSDGEGVIETLERSVSVYRRLGDKAGLASALQNSSQMQLFVRANLNQASALSQESVALCRELGERRRLCLALYKRGNVLYYLGDLKAARDAFWESLNLANGCGEVMLTPMATWKLATVLAVRGETRAAETGLQDAVAGLQKIKAIDARILGSEARLALAQLRRDQGRPADAERECREVLAELASQKEMEDQEKLTLVCLTRTLLDQGKVPEARQALSRAAAIPHRWPGALEDMDAELCEAEVLRAEGKAGQAEQGAEKVLAKAEACGDVPQRFDALLLLGKIELETGRVPQGMTRLNALQQEATAKGWLLVARQAKAAKKGRG